MIFLYTFTKYIFRALYIRSFSLSFERQNVISTAPHGLYFLLRSHPLKDLMHFRLRPIYAIFIVCQNLLSIKSECTLTEKHNVLLTEKHNALFVDFQNVLSVGPQNALLTMQHNRYNFVLFLLYMICFNHTCYNISLFFVQGTSNVQKSTD